MVARFGSILLLNDGGDIRRSAAPSASMLPLLVVG
jgi:hypothetical protein